MPTWHCRLPIATRTRHAVHPTTPLQSAAALPRDPFLTDLRRANAAFQVRCIFDVGANIGQSTDRFRRACPEAIIHAFEPIGQSYAALYSRFATDNFVRCENLALGAKAAGTCLLYTSPSPRDS